jgi:hypothetical protein
MRKGSRLTFGHLSYVASYKHPTARKSAAGAAISWRVRPSVIGVEYALIVVCRVTARFAFTPRPICPATGECVSQPPTAVQVSRLLEAAGVSFETQVAS